MSAPGGGGKAKPGAVVKAAAGVDNTHRRTWDRAEFAERAAAREAAAAAADESKLDARKRRRLERDPLHQGLIVQRGALKARAGTLDLASRLGRSQVVSAAGPLSAQGGYYCSVCECVLKDSLSYLDHINGKYHNRALGMSMTVERSSAEDVRRALAAARAAKGAGPTGAGVEEGGEHAAAYLPDGVTAEALEREEAEARRRGDASGDDEGGGSEDEGGGGGGGGGDGGAPPKQQQGGGDDDEEEEGLDPDMAAMMGFGGFGTSKR